MDCPVLYPAWRPEGKGRVRPAAGEGRIGGGVDCEDSGRGTEEGESVERD